LGLLFVEFPVQGVILDAFGWIMTAFSALIGILGGLCTVGLPVIIVVGLALLLYRQNQKSNAARQAAQTWQVANGTVLTSTIQVRRTGKSRSEIPVIVYQYEVAGKMFQNQTIRAGEKYFTVRVAGQTQATVARYPAGASVSVYYNPANPAESALER
jgi:hypothetical protein